MGRLLGWNVFLSAVGSTGYVADGGGGGKVKYRDRFTSDVTALDSVIPGGVNIVSYSGGYNDTSVSGMSAAVIQAEATLLFAKCASELPDARQILVLPFTAQGVTTTNLFTQIRDGLKTAADALSITSIDPVGYPSAQSWITGNGHSGATNGSGNADFYVGLDDTHPTTAGQNYMGHRAAQGFSDVLS